MGRHATPLGGQTSYARERGCLGEVLDAGSIPASSTMTIVRALRSFSIGVSGHTLQEGRTYKLDADESVLIGGAVTQGWVEVMPDGTPAEPSKPMPRSRRPTAWSRLLDDNF